MDADGYVHITDRKKDIIIKGGENISPREIEEIIYLHPSVAEAAVVAVPDPDFGEEICAVVQLRAGASATESEIRNISAVYQQVQGASLHRVPTSAAEELDGQDPEADTPGSGGQFESCLTCFGHCLSMTEGFRMTGRISLSGPAQYRLMSASILSRCTAEVCLRRLLKGPRSPEWNFAAELATKILKRRLISAFELNDVNAARSFLDSVALDTGITSKVSISNVVEGNVRGSWFVPKNASEEKFMLYLHGGGYSFYPKASYHNLIAMFALSADVRIFVLDYRLSPEHKFPAQLTDAVDSYRWLLGKGIDPARLIVAGDSAGGNLTLALLLSTRDLKLPTPALGICLSPATDFGDSAARLPQESELDWITQRMALQWADWYCSPAERANPLVSPVNADLRNLPPIYIQAGGAENLLPSIQDFVDRAKSQGAEVALEVWPAMNHVFQAFAPEVPQSTAALRRIREVIDARLRTTANPTASL